MNEQSICYILIVIFITERIIKKSQLQVLIKNSRGNLKYVFLISKTLKKIIFLNFSTCTFLYFLSHSFSLSNIFHTRFTKSANMARDGPASLDFWENATCGLTRYLSDCVRTNERKGGSSVEGIGFRRVSKRTREEKAARNKGVESRGVRSPHLRLSRQYEYTSVKNTCHQDARALL